MPRRKSKEEELEVIAKYLNGKSISAIQSECACGIGTIYRILKTHKVEKRKHPAEYGRCKNRNFFESIDTEEKAYFLGLLIADGSTFGNRITLTLQRKDKSTVEAFAEAVGIGRETVRDQSPRGKSNWQSRARFSSRKMCEDLAKFGFVPNKTKTTYLPQIDKHLMNHLVRGIFDGDGHVSRYAVYISGTETMCKQIQSLLNKEGVDTYLREQASTGVWYLRGSKKKGRTEFLKYMYRNSTVSMERKRAIAFETHNLNSPC